MTQPTSRLDVLSRSSGDLKFNTPYPYHCLHSLNIHGFDTGVFKKSRRWLTTTAIGHVTRLFDQEFVSDGVALVLLLIGPFILERPLLFVRFLQLLQDNHLQSWDVLKVFHQSAIGVCGKEKALFGDDNASKRIENLKDELLCKCV